MRDPRLVSRLEKMGKTERILLLFEPTKFRERQPARPSQRNAVLAQITAAETRTLTLTEFRKERSVWIAYSESRSRSANREARLLFVSTNE